MPGQIFRYDAVTAKCRSLIGRLMTREQYTALASRNNFADAVAYLKDSTAYASLFDDIDPSKIHRARIERILENNLLGAYKKLYIFTSGSERTFIGYMLEELEIKYLLHAIRATDYDDSMEFYEIPNFIREHSKINFAAIYETDSKDAILDTLKGGYYYDLLAPIFSRNSSFSQIEAELYRNYYKKLLTKYISVFTGEQKKRIRQAITTKIDLMNLSVILRMRKFTSLHEGKDRVKLDITDVLPLLMPFFGKLGESEIIRLCKDELSIGEAIDRFAELYRKPREFFGIQNSTGEYGSPFLYDKAKRLAAESKPSFDIVFGYLSLLKFETDNIIYILEALRYGVPAKEIEQSIII
jgi:V/A-type H+-transporting ATPase subunit C